MPKFKYSKLVRDKIVDHQIASGAKPNFRKLRPNEHKQELINKIVEEAKEISEANMNEIATEIADVQQALDDLKFLYGLNDTDIEKAQKARNKKAGAFKKGMYIEYVELADDDPWIDYYRKNAHRYPEIN